VAAGEFGLTSAIVVFQDRYAAILALACFVCFDLVENVTAV
jgi:hypothetical protein